MPSLRSRLLRAYLKYRSAKYDISAPIATRRELLNRVGERFPLPRNLICSKTKVGAVPCEWLSFPNVPDNKLLLYIHGGGYVSGSPRSHRHLVASLAKQSDIPALLIDYRLAPEHPFPAGLSDVLTVYKTLLAEGFSAENIIIAGDSAGGGMSLSLLLSLRSEDLPLPKAAVLLSPWTDLTISGASIKNRQHCDPYLRRDAIDRFVKYYCQASSPGHPLISPLFADLQGLPPLFIQAGNDEILLDDSVRLAENARAAGVTVEITIWPHMWHVWQFFIHLLPESRRANQDIVKFIKDTFNQETEPKAYEYSTHTG